MGRRGIPLSSVYSISAGDQGAREGEGGLAPCGALRNTGATGKLQAAP